MSLTERSYTQLDSKSNESRRGREPLENPARTSQNLQRNDSSRDERAVDSDTKYRTVGLVYSSLNIQWTVDIQQRTVLETLVLEC